MGKLKTFLKVNLFAFAMGSVAYVLHVSFTAVHAFAWSLPLHYLLYSIVENRNKFKRRLTGTPQTLIEPSANNISVFVKMISSKYVLLWCVFETATNYLIFLEPSAPLSTYQVLYEMATFIPKTFVFEVIFDLFFYWQHFFLHKIKWLYRHVHKIHHAHGKNISLLTTYQLHPGDLVLTTLSMYLTSCVVPLYELQYFSWIIFKIVEEQAGHIAVDNTDSCFSQCIWIPRYLDIDLNNSDHYQHHTLNNCNYGKRFSLWDKVFGTFKPHVTKEIAAVTVRC